MGTMLMYILHKYCIDRIPHFSPVYHT